MSTPGNPEVPPPQMLVGTGRAVISDTPVDPGNIVRRALLYADDGKTNYLTVGLATALHYLAAEGITLMPQPDGQLRLGKALIPPLDDGSGPYIQLDSRGFQILLDYKGGISQFTQESVTEVLDGDDAVLPVRDRAVVIGVVAESVRDDVITPFSTGFGTARAVRGMTMHALLADQLAREALYGVPIVKGPSRALENLWIWSWALAGVLLGIRLRYTIQALAGIGAGLAMLGGAVYAAFGAAVLLPAIPAAIAWVGSTGVTNRLLHAASNRDRARLRRTFEHYLPPVVIADMIGSDALPKLGGERREISVLFTDIANFTTLSETMEPEAVAALLNEYFAGACQAIFANGGLVYEFIGDAVLAFFVIGSSPSSASEVSISGSPVSAFIQGSPWSAISARQAASNIPPWETCSIPARASKGSTRRLAPGFAFPATPHVDRSVTNSA